MRNVSYDLKSEFYSSFITGSIRTWRRFRTSCCLVKPVVYVVYFTTLIFSSYPNFFSLIKKEDTKARAVGRAWNPNTTTVAV